MSARAQPPLNKPAQVRASDPAASVFVAANAGSGKTSTLVRRVARLLLRGARPETVLCVTYTKAAAAEMQRRLFRELGDWAVMDDAPLKAKLAELDERARDLGDARALFARALETPGGIKITTIHAFCEKLLKRFPLEAGVSPGFTVLDDAATREVAAVARERVAQAALDVPDGPIGRAYAYFSVELDYGRFQDMFAAFEAERRAIRAYADACEPRGYGTDIWKRCGFERETYADELEADAVARIRWGQWRRAAEALQAGTEATDLTCATAMLRIDEASSFASSAIWCVIIGHVPAQRVKMKSATHTVPVASTASSRSSAPSFAAWCTAPSTALCSIGVPTMALRPAALSTRPPPRIAMLSPSVPPEVKQISSGLAPRNCATRPRASSSAVRASRPHRCVLDGLPNRGP